MCAGGLFCYNRAQGKILMPSRKAEQIIKVLRDEILSGKRTPGEKLPHTTL